MIPLNKKRLFIKSDPLKEDQVCFTRVEHLVNMRENIYSLRWEAI